MRMIRRQSVLRSPFCRGALCGLAAILAAGTMAAHADEESGEVGEPPAERATDVEDSPDSGSESGPDVGAAEAGPEVSGQPTAFVSIASGMPNGLYFPVAGGVAQILDASSRLEGMSFSAESTTGSWENVVRVNSGEFDFGIARSDRVFDAVMGTGSFASSGPLADLRLLFALHDESVTVIVRNDIAADTFSDLSDARINLGPEENNPVRVALTAALEAAGMMADEEGGNTVETDAGPTLLSISMATQQQALCDGEVDAIAYIAGHPIGTVHEAMTQCDARVVGFEQDVIEAVLQTHPYYKASEIPVRYYRGNGENDNGDGQAAETGLPSFGPVALMVTNAGVADETAEAVTQAVVEGIDQLRDLHPALQNLSIREILGSEFSAPLHDGALAFFRERGIQ